MACHLYRLHMCTWCWITYALVNSCSYGLGHARYWGLSPRGAAGDYESETRDSVVDWEPLFVHLALAKRKQP